MKVHLARFEPERSGGGWTFQRNFAKGFEISDDSPIYFISGASMVTLDEVKQMKDQGKKIVLRIDNATRNSRNKRNGMDRMKSKAELADLVIYQSQWAKKYLRPFLNKDGPVILNGCDQDIFYPDEKIKDSVIYSRFNRDETKNWEAARYWFATAHDGKLYIAGSFSPELIEGNFDFYNGEQYEYLGVLDERNYAKLLRRMESFLYTYFNDACSNSLIEAISSGCRIVGDKYYRNTGGATEIREAYRQNGREYFSLQRMNKEYENVLLSLTA